MAPTTIEVLRTYVGGPAPLGDPALGVVSGIAKGPVAPGTVLGLSAINLDGDDQADRTVHGGVDKAVYAYPSEHLAAWADDLDQAELAAGTHAVAPFGENLSTVGVSEDAVRIGDVWAWGRCRLEVCQPRWPCQKLTLHRHHARVGPMMRATGRTGWYLRVVLPGTVTVGDPIVVVDEHPAGVTVLDAHRAMLDRQLADRALVERVVGLGAALAAEWRDPLRARLDAAA